MANKTGTIGEFTFGGWTGQLVRPQKQLDQFRRPGSIGTEFQIVNTNGPDCSIATKLFAVDESSAVTIRDEINDLMGTITDAKDPFGVVYQRVIVKSVVAAVKGVSGGWGGVAITHCVDCAWVLEVLPESP